MEVKRKVDDSMWFSLLRSSKTGMIGLVFTLCAIVLFIFTVMISIGPKSANQKYDYQLIEKTGVENVAKIISVDTIEDVTIRGAHPKRINYVYIDNQKEVIDAFETMDLDKTAAFKRGQKIPLLTYQGQSMIKGLKPFSFAYYFFYAIAVVLFIIGFPLLLTGHKSARKHLGLYKNGVIKNGFIVSVTTAKKALPAAVKTTAKPVVIVKYYFLNEQGNKIYGESRTTDLSFQKENKEGDTINIFVDEKDEAISCIVPKIEAKKYNWVT